MSVHISHLKMSGRNNWGKMNDVFRKIDDARLKGLGLSCDMYPYIAGSTDLDAILPLWVHEGGYKRVLGKYVRVNHE